MLKAFVFVQQFLAGLHRDDRGATAVEYGLIVALIAAVITAGVTALGVNVQGMFSQVANSISGL
jgi:pilus assembly protein Flp/PilA